MKLVKLMKEIDGKDDKEIKIICHDPENAIAKLIEYIGKIGNIGHSFEIVVDPEMSEYKKTFGWDGDGSDRINEIYVDGEKFESEEK